MYRPKFVPQYNDPTTTLDWYDCTMASGAMGLDFDTLGHIQVLGGQLRNVSGDTSGGTSFGTPGLTQAWAHYGQVLHVETGHTFDDCINNLKQSRGAMLMGMYSALPLAYHSPLNSHNFGGPHCVYINPEHNSSGEWLMGDPLNDHFIWVPQAALLRYANALGSNQLGASIPQRIFFSVTDAHVPAVIPTDPKPYVHTVQVTASPTLNVRAQPTTTAAIVAPALAHGQTIKTTLLRVNGGKYVVGGVVRQDWLGFLRNGKTLWVARGWTKLIS
jgi:hypothetical protein